MAARRRPDGGPTAARRLRHLHSVLGVIDVLVAERAQRDEAGDAVVQPRLHAHRLAGALLGVKVRPHLNTAPAAIALTESKTLPDKY